MSGVVKTAFGEGKLLPTYMRVFRAKKNMMEYHRITEGEGKKPGTDELLVTIQLFHQPKTLIRKFPQVLVIQEQGKLDLTVLKGGTIKFEETGEVIWTYTSNSIVAKIIKKIKAKLRGNTTDGQIHQ